MQVESAALLDSPEREPLTLEHIYARMFQTMAPEAGQPAVEVEFRRWTGATARVRLEGGTLRVHIGDSLAGAPESVHESLAEILLCKLLGYPVPAASRERYRRYLNRQDVRRDLDRIRQARGRKRVIHPAGEHHDLAEIFEDLNRRYFFGLMARPGLGWSRQASRTTLGHYDSSHHVIVLSRHLDRAEVPALVVQYVMFHEMLHLRHPVEHHGARRCVHTPAFKAEERRFEGLREAKTLLRRLL